MHVYSTLPTSRNDVGEDQLRWGIPGLLSTDCVIAREPSWSDSTASFSTFFVSARTNKRHHDQDLGMIIYAGVRSCVCFETAAHVWSSCLWGAKYGGTLCGGLLITSVIKVARS